MDRFIADDYLYFNFIPRSFKIQYGQIYSTTVLLKIFCRKDLKSNMDRFIGVFYCKIFSFYVHLKSNMDRFIESNYIA